MPAGYVVETTADVALSAATAKTILSVINASNALIRITELAVSFDGVSATAEPVPLSYAHLLRQPQEPTPLSHLFSFTDQLERFRQPELVTFPQNLLFLR